MSKKCCCCKENKLVGDTKTISRKQIIRYLVLHVILFALWWIIYLQLKDFSAFVAYSWFAEGSRLGSALQFFLYDTPKILMLLSLIIYAVGILRSFITPEKTRRFLAGKKNVVGNILASMLGIITPFCSCSAVPLFIGFVTAGVPLGVTFSFLIAAPMINEVALILLYGMLGWKIASLYLITGLSVAISAGLIIGKINPEHYLEKWVLEIRATANPEPEKTINWHTRINFAYQSLKDILGRIWLYVLVGIAVAAIIHGYVPESFLALMLGAHTWWSVPLAVILGVPLYSNAAGIVPVIEALIGKGAAIGTSLAFMMSVVTLSFPEIVMLRKVLKMPLIYAFIITVTLGIVLVGYLFNFII